ncbi:MAG: 30S ribosomal protein S3 [Candidatus Woesearchaeota archaeon]|jgi:small subunit ribosomal protein S3|nr:30S ribosomal protein S3 [Candidatus Woesearchaeota archaeon]|tara:strand:- start:12782 stop:13603 length:822 start_codon:yes stop_codon:yes gene_type:complete
MIERKFVAQKMKESQIEEYITKSLENVGHSHTKMVKTPLGEKIIIFTSRPGLIVGRKGQNIKQLTKTLKKRFDLENPQIEISEVDNPNLDANIVVEKIIDALEKFGSSKFKSIGHKIMTDVMRAGALGIEIVVSGKVPSARARSWRFYSGYLKKCGDISMSVRRSNAQAQLKTGIVGVKVSIMPPDIKLPDNIELIDTKETKVDEVKKSTNEEDNEESKKEISEVKSSQSKDQDKATAHTETSQVKNRKSKTPEKPKRGRKKKNESKRTENNE